MISVCLYLFYFFDGLYLAHMFFINISFECNLFMWNKSNHAARAVIVVFLSIMPNSLKSLGTPIGYIHDAS